MSSDEYNHDHSITIGKNLLIQEGGSRVAKNTWTDWHLIPATRPLVNPPTPNVSMISIPGSDGALDLTDVLSGRATYSNRSGSWTFYVENDYEQWYRTYSNIMAFLQGKYYEVVLQDEPIYYYEGRLSVNEWRSDPTHSLIVINYNLDPYKKYKDYGGNYLWDTFRFGNPRYPSDKGDHIESYRKIKIAAGATKTLHVKNNYENSDLRIFVSGSGSKKTDVRIFTSDSESTPILTISASKGTTNYDTDLEERTYTFKIKNNDTSQITVSIYLTGGLL